MNRTGPLKAILRLESLIVLVLFFAFTGGARASPAAEATATPGGAVGRLLIVSPRENAVVPLGEVVVQVRPQDVLLDADHGWQLYLDDHLVETIPGDVMTHSVAVTISGPHTIQAALEGRPRSDPSGALVGITAAPATPTTPIFNPRWMDVAMGVMTLAIVVIIVAALRLSRRPAGY